MIEKIGWNFEHTYSDLPECFFSRVMPDPVKKHILLVFNSSLAQELGLNTDALSHPDAGAMFVGNVLPQGAKPIAQAYAGHQFANFTILGDGRAILLGEHITPQGKRFDIQLKGAGRTAFSRSGDGRASLGPMLREYLMSEALYALGISTTRSLAVAATGENVIRERIQPGAVLTRVASSHIRVGTFEFAAFRDDVDALAALTLYSLERHFPDFPENIPPAYTLLLRVIEAQAILIANWMSVGFIHGVMNTDNMTITGETIDYGPCAMMDHYHPNMVFSSIDQEGRYSFANQAQMALWNLERFAETLLPILDEDRSTAIDMAQNALDTFAEIFNANWLAKMGRKIGCQTVLETDQSLIKELLGLMQKHEWDFTNTFRSLILLADAQDKYKHLEASHSNDSSQQTKPFEPTIKHESQNAVEFAKPDFQNWLKRWRERLSQQELTAEQASDLMKKSNPTVIPRNHRVEAALQAAERGDLSSFDQLLSVLRNPFAESALHDVYAAPPMPHERVAKTFCGT